MPGMSALAESVGLALMVLDSVGLPGSLERVIMISGEHGVERIILKSVERVALSQRMRIGVFLILP